MPPSSHAGQGSIAKKSLNPKPQTPETLCLQGILTVARRKRALKKKNLKHSFTSEVWLVERQLAGPMSSFDGWLIGFGILGLGFRGLGFRGLGV